MSIHVSPNERNVTDSTIPWNRLLSRNRPGNNPGNRPGNTHGVGDVVMMVIASCPSHRGWHTKGRNHGYRRRTVTGKLRNNDSEQ